MTREQIEKRMAGLREELQRADEEAGKLRPRLQYLDTIMQRLDGALTALQGLLDEPDVHEAALAQNSHMAQPVAP